MRKRLILTLLVVSAMPVASARADVFLTPFLGATFGQDAPKTRTTYGVAVGGMGGGIGAELDFGYTPTFVDPPAGESGNLTTVMFNTLIGASGGPVRPYVTGGVGLIRQGRELTPSGILNDISANDFGFDVGGGVRFKLAGAIGLRGDVRYFRTTKSDGLKFWRGYVGLTLGS